jgi:hypothetical protein
MSWLYKIYLMTIIYTGHNFYTTCNNCSKLSKSIYTLGALSIAPAYTTVDFASKINNYIKENNIKE